LNVLFVFYILCFIVKNIFIIAGIWWESTSS